MLLLPKDAKIISQGLTGSEGQRALPSMLKYGTKIVAGITPGKGGQTLMGIPIFDSVKDAINAVGPVDGTIQFVPPLLTKKATLEAMDAGLKFILIGAEKVPTQDSAYIYALAQKNKATVLGPSSVGVISPHRQIKLGSIAGNTPQRAFIDGEVAIISKSGGMTSEIGISLKQTGLGVSWAAGIGGDIIACSDFADWLLELENDSKTAISIIFGELGGTYEEKVATLVAKRQIKKPVIAYIGGDFTLTLPTSVQFGHAGAIIEGEKGRPDYKRNLLREAGVIVADNFDQIPNLIKQKLS